MAPAGLGSPDPGHEHAQAPCLPAGTLPQKSVFVDTTLRPWPALKNLLFSRRPYHVDRFQSTAYQAALEETLATFRPDLIQVESPYLTPYVENLSLPRVYRLHNVEYLIWARLAREKPWPLRYYFTTQARRIHHYETRILHTYQGLIPISEKEAAFIQESGYRGPVALIPYAIAIEEYDAPPLREENPRIGFIGGLDWLPNLAGITWFLERCGQNLPDDTRKRSCLLLGATAPPLSTATPARRCTSWAKSQTAKPSSMRRIF